MKNNRLFCPLLLHILVGGEHCQVKNNTAIQSLGIKLSLQETSIIYPSPFIFLRLSEESTSLSICQKS